MSDDIISATPGTRIHVLGPGLLLFGYARRRGDEIVVSQQDYDGSRDLTGASYLDDLSEEAQMARWGDVRLGIGPFPADLHRWTPGTPEAAEAREIARRAAYRKDTPAEVRAALAEVQRVFGDAPATSRTVRERDDGPDEYEIQRERLNREGPRMRIVNTAINGGF